MSKGRAGYPAPALVLHYLWQMISALVWSDGSIPSVPALRDHSRTGGDRGFVVVGFDAVLPCKHPRHLNAQEHDPRSPGEHGRVPAQGSVRRERPGLVEDDDRLARFHDGCEV